MSVSVIILVGIGLAIIIFFLSRLFLTSPKISSLFDLIKTGKTSQAIKLARTLLSKQPRNAEVHYLLGQAYLSENKPDQALGEFKIVNQIGVFRGYLKEIDFRRKMAELYQTFGQPEEALKEYALLIKLDPKSAQNYYNIGVFLEKQNKPVQAF